MNEEIQNQPPPKRKRIQRAVTVLTTVPFINETISIEEPLIRQIGRIADDVKVQLYIVGGFVRDYMLEIKRADYDFIVVGDSIAFSEVVAKELHAKAVVYPRFRTASVTIEGIKCEFVGTRKEEYLPDSRNPIVTEGTLEDDLRRRDLTINAMAVSVNKEYFGRLIDIFRGKEDLALRILRTPLDPSITFNDDPLRMLRIARFASQLGFRIENSALEAMTSISERIKIISQERITEEMMKIIASPKPSVGLSILHNTKLMEHVFPEIERLSGIETVFDGGREYAHKDVMLHSFQVLDKIAALSENEWFRFAALIHDIAKPLTKKFIPGTGWSFHGHEELGANYVERLFRRMKLPMDKVDYVEKLVRLHQRPMALLSEEVTDSAVRRLAFQAGNELEDLFTLCRADITTNNPDLSQRYLRNYTIVQRKVINVQEKDKLREFQSPVRGEEIMEICGLKPSKPVGIIKSKIEEAILDGIIPNEYEAAKEYLLANKDEWMREIEEGMGE
jgi:poly(A) polymerase